MDPRVFVCVLGMAADLDPNTYQLIIYHIQNRSA